MTAAEFVKNQTVRDASAALVGVVTMTIVLLGIVGLLGYVVIGIKEGWRSAKMIGLILGSVVAVIIGFASFVCLVSWMGF